MKQNKHKMFIPMQSENEMNFVLLQLEEQSGSDADENIDNSEYIPPSGDIDGEQPGPSGVGRANDNTT